MEGKDPAIFIKDGLSKTLVFYYPLAGRIIEGPNRKLMVNCNSEGILFVEADANVELEKLGESIKPPCHGKISRGCIQDDSLKCGRNQHSFKDVSNSQNPSICHNYLMLRIIMMLIGLYHGPTFSSPHICDMDNQITYSFLVAYLTL
ncbi:hypothetical protein RND71_032203 [Anisodus tanguticus]|uniref:Uncharacterized protein n=1 Tax=Anisodus tanguticus TaxID=243964 RepID=A0AAE1UY62_9SOLA|nr:hypothetical protein RND71_032203 [Anisodus tanguticus]